MVEKYSGNAGSTRAIYHTSHMMPYLVFLGGAKFLRAVGIFMSYDILKVVHVVQFLFLVKSCSAVFLVFIQKPFTSGKRISKHQWFRISRHALLGSILTVLWLFGLSLCGPLRTILLFEHSDMVVLAGAAALFTNNTTPSRFRGAVFFLLAVMSILLFDHDDVTHHGTEHQQHHNSAFLSHLFNHLTHFTGLSDHKGGVVLLFLTLGLQVGYNSAAKKLSVDVGGAKRLHALSTLVSALLLMPWALFVFATKESLIPSWWSLAVPIVVVAVFLHVLDYYADALAVAKAEAWRAQRYGGVAVCGAAMALGVLWNHPLVLGITPEQAAVLPEDHVLSGGVVFSFALILFATHILTNPQKGSKGSMVGYSASGLPLYNFPAGDAIQRTSQSMLTLLRNGLRQILEDSDSRKIFYFLCINLSFTFVELLYGVWTNSLGLISDGFHMLFDCWALVMGLYASVMARWKATRTFSYGYDRVEILSGFTNGLFLMVIAFFVFLAACTRLFDPPEIHTERLLAVSVLGLVVNLLGIVAFRHGHSHGGGGHGHSHGGGGHGHSHGGHGHGHSHGHDGLTDNANMEGVFLHVLADTLGSVGVIISTLFIENFGWTIADPICSLFIATLIFVSVMPLVKETALVLLLRTPGHMQDELATALHKILKVEGVLSYRKEHFWRHSSKVVCGTIHVQTAPEASEQKTIAQVTSILKEVGVQNLTIQVEKQAFYQHMTGLGFSLDDVMERTDTIKALDYNTHASYYIKAI